jgi:Fic family protein
VADPLYKLTTRWVHEYVIESNKIDPQKHDHQNSPGDAHYDDHVEALYYVIDQAVQNRLADPVTVHSTLMRNLRGIEPQDVGQYRRLDVWVGQFKKLRPEKIAAAMVVWNGKVEDEINYIRSGQLSQEEKRTLVWGLHCHYENIHPWVDGNGRSGRLLMVNHALVLGLDPWIIHYGDEQQAYYQRIAGHPTFDLGFV